MAILAAAFHGGAAAASYVSYAAHALALTAAILIIVWVAHFGGGANLNSDDPDLIFNVHPLVMTLGFIIVTGEAIMAYKTVPGQRSVQKKTHMLLHLLALGLGTLGIYAAFKFHSATQLPDLCSLHSWLGICTICLFALQWAFGLFCFGLPVLLATTRAMMVPVHSTAGLAVFLMAICTAETGLMQKGGDSPVPENRLVNFAGLILLLFALLVSLSTAIPRIISL